MVRRLFDKPWTPRRRRSDMCGPRAAREPWTSGRCWRRPRPSSPGPPRSPTVTCGWVNSTRKEVHRLLRSTAPSSPRSLSYRSTRAVRAPPIRPRPWCAVGGPPAAVLPCGAWPPDRAGNRRPLKIPLGRRPSWREDASPPHSRERYHATAWRSTRVPVAGSPVPVAPRAYWRVDGGS